MRKLVTLPFITISFLLSCVSVPTLNADVHYVATNGSHDPPHTNWPTAATNIQAALDYAGYGDLVLVSNGTYLLSAQIEIDDGVTVRSVNGPEKTTVDGNGVTRCLYLSHSNAVVDGFTITGGLATYSADDDSLAAGGGVYFDGAGTVCNSLLFSNVVHSQGWSAQGGGAYFIGGGSLLNSRVQGNQANAMGSAEGAGVWMSEGGVVENCLIVANQIVEDGSGFNQGGGVYMRWGARVSSCTIAENKAVEAGGGVSESDAFLVNCILSDNQAGNFRDLKGDSIACWFGSPPFVDSAAGDFHLQEGSLCIDAATTEDIPQVDYDYVVRPTDGDLDGVAHPDIGAFEYVVTALRCTMVCDKEQGFMPLPVTFNCRVGGTNLVGLQYQWDFDADGVWDLEGENLGIVGHTYTNGGWKSVSVRVQNAAGEVTMVTHERLIKVGAERIHVSPGGSATRPFSDWATAATEPIGFEDLLVDGTTVLVADGHYMLSAEIVIDRAVSLTSVNGPLHTILDANNTRRCVVIADDGAVLTGFTLTGGYGWAANYVSGTLKNCIIRDCHAESWGKVAGATYLGNRGRLENCLIYNNTAECLDPRNTTRGTGGVMSGGGRLINCTITANTLLAGRGGGGYQTALNAGGTVRNCIIWGNASPEGTQAGTWAMPDPLFTYCCMPTDVYYTENRVDGPPQFLNPASGDYRLQGGSPCVDSGEEEAWMWSSTDLAGTPRVCDGDNDGVRTPDVGAYEFVHPLTDLDDDGLPYLWEVQYFGTYTNADGGEGSDWDHDGFCDRDEFLALTDPTDPESLLRLSDLSFTGVTTNKMVAVQDFSSWPFTGDEGPPMYLPVFVSSTNEGWVAENISVGRPEDTSWRWHPDPASEPRAGWLGALLPDTSAWIMSPALSSAGRLRVVCRSTRTGKPQSFAVQVSGNGSSGWESVATLTNQSVEWTTNEVTLGIPAPTRVRIYRTYEGDLGQWLGIDDISITEAVRALVLCWQTSTGRVYTLQVTPSLDLPWSNVTGCVEVPGTGGPICYTNDSSAKDAEFYRVRLGVPE